MKHGLMTSVAAPWRVLALCLPVAAVLVASAPAAHAQDVTSREGLALQNQIMALKQSMSQMQSSGSALAPPSATPAPASSGNGDLTAQLLDRVNTLEQQQRDMRGEIDQLTNELQQKSAALSKQIADNQFAAQNGGGGAAAPAAAAGPAGAAAASSPSHTAATTPDALLASGKAALQKRDYATAHENAEEALKNAKGSFKVDAQFLLAQSLAGEKQYRQSAVAYYDAYRQSPKSTRAPDALLGVSASLLALGDKKAACQALGKLKTEFPSPTQRVSHAAEIYAGRGGCQ
ncbi:hypothetical protein NKW54_03130 [Acetobacter cerevisiae]|uniref:YbgF trimerisation domain-containing protein n=2 Tax=Acetobacter cerevisiae TaxID=178900 RepID=A0ABT1ENH7_9PROT|nr:hypothetical protein [Acetobacter cerevisiae]MCP1244933.1 hypothetical protein [Acetobacter cerevisiae]MCP1254510.1 hypothetical protein [Acetobacter cerevisiae]